MHTQCYRKGRYAGNARSDEQHVNAKTTMGGVKRRVVKKCVVKNVAVEMTVNAFPPYRCWWR